MDLLTLPVSLTSHDLVPDLGGPEYDNAGFKGYPTRQGWQIDKLRKGDITGARLEWDEYSQICMKDIPADQFPESSEDLIMAVTGPFIQTWIFFGLFHEALGRSVLRSECLVTRVDQDGSTKKYLSARLLFAEFARRKDQIKDDVVWCENFSSCLRDAAWVLNDLDTLSVTLGGYIIPGVLHLALGILVNTLDNYSVIWCQPHIRPANASVTRTRWFEQELLDRKWCPNLIRRLDIDLGLEGLYFASLLSSVAERKQHDACTELACVACNIGKDEKYTIWHSMQYCSCMDKTCTHCEDGCFCTEPTNIENVFHEVSAIIQKGQIALISIRKVDSGIVVEVTPFRQGMKYIAISHVWSDGMGNPHKNSLPSCTLQALDDVVNKAFNRSSISGPSTMSYFWIDTLCVPLTPENVRATAIASMRQIYANSDCVLVVCRDLWSIPLPLTPDETLVRIFRCNWMTRLWTIPEGALAATLAFQFADSAIDYDYLDDLMVAANYDIIETSRLVGNRANLSLSSVTSFASKHSAERTNRQQLYSSLWSALRHRSTSKTSDIAICAGILLDMDLRPILASPNEKKMETFWISQQKIPSGILWVNGPRMDRDTLRWAPISLLDPRTWALSLSAKGPWASRTTEGLKFQGIEGFQLQGLPLPTADGSAIEFIDNRSREKHYITLMGNVGNSEWKELADQWTRCALLWHEVPTRDSSSAGALVSCRKIDSGTIYARWLAQVRVFVKGGEWDATMLESPSEFLDGEVIRKEVTIVSVPVAEYIGVEQEWCIW
jgi:hypothetical protein